MWDTRKCTNKNPAELKFAVSTPFTIRRIQWAPAKSDNSYQLAVQCDRSIRIYDIRRIDSTPVPLTDIEHSQRIVCMDWTAQSRSILSLAVDHSLRIHASHGSLLADSLPDNTSNILLNKVRAIPI